MMYGLVVEGGPTYWDQATGLLDWGFAQDRVGEHRHAVARTRSIPDGDLIARMDESCASLALARACDDCSRRRRSPSARR